jgi:hypothetical protein
MPPDYGIRKEEIDPWTSQAFAVCNITTLPSATLDALLRNDHAWLFKDCDTRTLPPPPNPAVIRTPAKRPISSSRPRSPGSTKPPKKKGSLGTAEKNKRILRHLEAEVAKAIESHPDRVASFTKPRPEPGPPSTHHNTEEREKENRRIRYAHVKECAKWNHEYLAHLTGVGKV